MCISTLFLLRYLYINITMLIYLISTILNVDIQIRQHHLKRLMLTYMYINIVLVEISLYQHYDVDISYINNIEC